MGPLKLTGGVVIENVLETALTEAELYLRECEELVLNQAALVALHGAVAEALGRSEAALMVAAAKPRRI